MRKEIDLEQFLFQLQRLEEQGVKTQSLQEETWERIKDEIEGKVDQKRLEEQILFERKERRSNAKHS